jgi:hypothetical protein
VQKPDLFVPTTVSGTANRPWTTPIFGANNRK